MCQSIANARLTETELRWIISRCRRGDRAAFDLLVRDYQKRIFRMAYRMCGQYDEANDICADTMLRVFRSIGNFREEAQFDTWLRRIVFNVFLDRRKRASNRRQVSLTDYIHGDESGPAWDLIDTAPTPDLIAEEHERRDILLRAVASLPNDQRDAVVSCYGNGDTYVDIALALAIPVGTVKSRLSRARCGLRKGLQPLQGCLTGRDDVAGSFGASAAFPGAVSLVV